MSRFFRDTASYPSDDEDYYEDSDYNEKYGRDGSNTDSSYESGSDGSDHEGDGEGFGQEALAGADIEEPKKRAPRSARQRYESELREICKKINSGSGSGEWLVVAPEYDKLVKIRTTSQFSQESNPRFVARALHKMDVKCSAISGDKSALRSMTTSESRAFNVLRQKLRRTRNMFDEDIKKWVANPVNSDESDAESNEFEERDEDDLEKDLNQKSADKLDEKDEEKAIDEKKFEPKIEDLYKHLSEISLGRGKKATDKFQQVEHLMILLEITVTPYEKCRVLAALISARIDTTSFTGPLKRETWLKAVREFSDLVDILWENKDISLVTNNAESLHEASKGEPPSNKVIHFNASTLVKCLYKEFCRSLEMIDSKTMKYIERLSDEVLLYILTLNLQKYFESVNCKEQVMITAFRRLGHIYYKPNYLIAEFQNKFNEAKPHLAESIEPQELIKSICSMLFTSPEENFRTYAFLCYVYNSALNDKFNECRDLMLMSHLQSNIFKADIPTQTLYNRVIVQIGLCAFRNRMIKAASTILSEIVHASKSKELLAQGTNPVRGYERNKKKAIGYDYLPFFTHINIELLEIVYFTCIMLLEIPAVVMGCHETKRKPLPRYFSRLFDFTERQVFSGVPENTRDHIVAASCALAVGDWATCAMHIKNMKIWDLMSNTQYIKDMLTEEIKQESLRVYLSINSSYYSTIVIKSLQEIFEIPEKKIITIFSKMVIDGEIDAGLDENDTVISVKQNVRPDLIKTQRSRLMYIEKISSLLDTNEKTLEGILLDAGIYLNKDTRDKGTFKGSAPRRDNKYAHKQNPQRNRYNQTPARYQNAQRQKLRV